MRLTNTAAGLPAIALVAAGCSSTDNTAPPPPASFGAPASSARAAPEQRTEAAVRKAAAEEFDSYASGDYGGAWDLWATVGKKAISRKDYRHLFELCPQLASGVRFQIDHVTMDSDREAHVRATRLIGVFTYQFVYESGHWRFVPDAESMRDYRTKTVEEMASEHRAAGACAR